MDLDPLGADLVDILGVELRFQRARHSGENARAFKHDMPVFGRELRVELVADEDPVDAKGVLVDRHELLHVQDAKIMRYQCRVFLPRDDTLLQRKDELSRTHRRGSGTE